MDISPASLSPVTEPNLTRVCGDLIQLSGNGEFDFIYCIDVLEHIPGNLRVIQNFYAALSPGGYLFLHMPDDRKKRRILPERFFREFAQWARHEHTGEQYSLPELSRLLRNEGFSILHARCTFAWPGRFAWELDRLTDRRRTMKIVLMPILKLFARLSVHLRPSHGGVLVLAQK